MDWSTELKNNKNLKDRFLLFLEQYGLEGLEQAIKLYTDDKEAYICKSRTAVFRIRIPDIFYLKINGHLITVYTTNGAYEKYGTLTGELRVLESHGFIRCSQSCIVSLSKITGIQGSDLILTNQERLRISRGMAPKVMVAFMLGRTG